MVSRILALIGIVEERTRETPHHRITGRIHSVTDVSGEHAGRVLRVQYQQTMRDSSGKIRATRILRAK